MFRHQTTFQQRENDNYLTKCKRDWPAILVIEYPASTSPLYNSIAGSVMVEICWCCLTIGKVSWTEGRRSLKAIESSNQSMSLKSWLRLKAARFESTLLLKVEWRGPGQKSNEVATAHYKNTDLGELSCSSISTNRELPELGSLGPHSMLRLGFLRNRPLWYVFPRFVN